MKTIFTLLCCTSSLLLFAQPKNIYQKGWINFNKNGRKDVFEDSTQTVAKGIQR